MRSLWLDGTQSFEDLSNEPLTALIAGVIDEGATVFLTGQPGTGKSFAAVSIAASVVSGAAWHEREVLQGSVLYVVAEDTPQRIRDRFLAWSAHHCTPLDFDALRYITSFDFSKPETVSFLVDLVASQPIALVIVDTLFSASSGIDTESAKEVKVINEVIARVKAASIVPLTFLTVSHANKSQPGQISGSLQLKGLADSVLSMTKTRGSYRLGFDKNRHGSEELSLAFSIAGVDLPGSNSPVGVLVSSETKIDSTRTKNEELVLALLAQVGDWVSSSTIQKQAELAGLGRSSFYKARTGLIEAGKATSRENARGSELKVSNEFSFSTVQNEPNETDASVRFPTHASKAWENKRTIEPSALIYESDLF